MNGGAAALSEAAQIAEAVRGMQGVRIGLCPPATLLERLAAHLSGSPVLTGGQDCHDRDAGAFTGEVSAKMLAEAGARLVILGHSERRAAYAEGDERIAAKVRAALDGDLEPIICIGETLAQHEGDDTLAVVAQQLRGALATVSKTEAFAIAYEPVWAIGSGRTATSAHIEQVHRFIRSELEPRFAHRAPILYGGSVSAASSDEISRVAEVGGFLVGGASLKAATFLPIVSSAAEAALTAIPSSPAGP